MAKTASQIKAQNKERNEKIQQVVNYSKSVDRQNFDEKSAAKTIAVLAKAISGTSDPGKKSELSRAKQLVTDSYKQYGIKESAAEKPEAKHGGSGGKWGSDAKKQYEGAKKVYDDYTASDEHKRRLGEANKTALEQAMQRVFSVPGVSASDAPIGSLSPIPTDSKERELSAITDYYSQQVEAEKNQRITDANLKELESWSEEDRSNLEKYMAQRDQYASGAMAGQTQFDTYNLNPLIEKYGDKKVRQMAESLQWSRNAELMEKTEEAGQKRGDEHAVLGSGESVLTNLAGAYTGPLGFVKEMSQRTGQYSTFDPNNVGNLPAAFGGAVREQVTEDIRGDGDHWLRNLGALAYQGLMSSADSAARMVSGGGSAGISSVLASSGTFSNSIRQYSQQGVSPEQAAAMAVVNAGMEYATEKLPTDEVLKLFKGGTKKGTIGKILAQAFLVEPTSEEVNLFAGVAAEAAILGDKSSQNQKIGEMVANGMSYQDAQKQYFTELWREAAETYAVSAISGGLSAGGAAAIGGVINGSQDTEVENTAAPESPAVTLEEQEVQAIPDTAPLVEGIQDMTPPPEPLTEGQRAIMAAMDRTMGVEAQKNTAETGGIWDKLRGYTQHEKENWKTSKRIVLCDSIEHFRQFVSNALTSKTQTHKKMYFGAITPNLATEIQNATGVNVEGYNLSLGEDEVRKINKSHGNENKESLRGQRAVTEADYLEIPYIVQNADSIKRSDSDYEGKPAIEFQRRNENEITTVVAVVSDKRLDVFVQTEYINKKSGSIATPKPVQADFFTPEATGGTAPSYSIPESNLEVNENAAAQSDYYDEFENYGGQIKGTGAAEENFSGKPAYNATLAADNAQADRRDDVRPMELPAQDINGGNVSAVTGNVYGSRITPDDFASLMEEPTAKGDFSYAKITNDQATQRATETIASAGTWENAYDSWKQSVTIGNAGAEMSARGALFLNHAAQQGNKQLWLETLHYMQKLGTNTAQGLQAFRIIRTLKPVDKIEFVKMSVEKMVTEVKEKHGIDLEIDQTLIDEFEQAETDEDRDAVLEDIQQNVADQIPSTFLDKWTALRYMNMLGNLKTNVRNIAGNVGSAAVYRIKDTIATGMEAIASKVSGGKIERTKSLFVRKSLLDACKKDFQQFRETVSSGGKYGERMSATSQFEQGVQDKRRIFNNPLLEGYRKGTNWMMNNEYFGDEAFGRAAYSRALAGYLQANGVNSSDLSKVDTALLDKARTYAIKEAQEATFHDNSALAKIVSKVQKDTGFVGQAIMPFTKTPANVLTRAEEFSPLGLINSTVKSIQKARGNADISGADVINSWAKSITGVGLFALGAAMMDQGLLTGGPDEDEEKADFDNLNGYQNYAIQLPDGTNYTIDWLTPAAMPMFMGAQFWKMLSSDWDVTFADMEQVFTSIADPMIQMSMLQGLNNSLDGIKNSDNNLGQFFINAAISYLTQGLTNTLMGQIERSTEENRQTTYIDKNSNTPEWLQRQLGKASQKIPGWDYQQMDYRNAWGQTEKNEGGLLYNLLSPGYVSKEQSNRITQELYRLRETTGENVFPQPVEKTVTYTDVTGTKHVNRALTKTELDTIQRVEGQTAGRLLAEITANEDYNSLTDDQRAAVIANVYKYAQEHGKKEALAGYYSEAAAWMQNMGDDAGNALVQKAVLDYAKNSISATQDAKKNGFSADIQRMNDQKLKQSYDVYSKMSQDAKETIREDATGTLSLYLEARDDGMSHKDFMYLLDGIEEVKPGKSHDGDIETYLEIRDHGVSENDFLSSIRSISELTPEEGFKNIRDIQKWESIANLNGVSARIKDVLVKAYMDDGSTTEAKYDAIRELGVSPQGYTDAYRDYLDASGTGKRRRTIAHYMKTYGWDRSTAQKVYDIYAGYYKPWE